VDNTYIKDFMDHFFNLIFLGKGVTIRTNIGKKVAWCQGNGMIMNTTGRREALGSLKDQLMFIKDGLDVLQYRGSLCCFCGMEFGDNNRMTLFEQLFMRWELMISGEPTVIPWNIY
jgi:hypothetical protein